MLLGFTLLSILSLQQPLQAQLPGLSLSAEDTSRAPNIPTFRYGNLDVAPVFVDGVPIHWVASAATLRTDHDPPSVPQAAFRAQLIQSKLEKLLADMDDAARQEPLSTLADYGELRAAIRAQLSISVDTSGEAPVILGSFSADAPAEILLTVTEADALLIGEPGPRIAAKLKLRLEKELMQYWEQRQWPHLWQQAQVVFLVFLLTLAVSMLLALGQRRLRQRAQSLRQNRDRELSMLHGLHEEPQSRLMTPLETLKLQLKRFTFQHNYNLNLFIGRTLFWLNLLLWVISIGWICSQFYWSRPLGNWILGIHADYWLLSWGRTGTLGVPLMLVLLFLTLTTADRLTNFLIDRFTRSWLENQVHTAEAFQRASLRIPTLATAAKGVTTAIAYIVFIIIALSQFRAIATPITALLSIVLFGFSLGAQNLIRDVINGVLILVEDQYAVGDVVSIGEAAGLVENLNLRITQLRSLEGELITIPNGSVGQVCNMSSGWSRAKFTIEIANTADIDRAVEVLQTVADQLYAEPEWADRVLEEPELLGVEKLDYTGVQLLMLLKTKPLQQWNVVREYRRRVKQALDQAGIDLGLPRQGIYLEMPHSRSPASF